MHWGNFAGPVFVLLGTSLAHADAQGDWLAQRQAQFTQWQAAHPNVDAQIADLKAKTAALIAQSRAPATAKNYDNLLAQSRGISPAQKQQALTLFGTGFSLWKSGDFPAAKLAFNQGLGIDPANAPGNYYYGDILQRADDQAGAAEYYARAASLGGTSAEGFKAQTALQTLPKADPLAKVSMIYAVPGAPTEIWDTHDAPQMTIIPAGEYAMGSPDSELGHLPGEGPQHRVTISAPFAIGRYDVTFAEWDACVAGGGCNGYKPSDQGWGRGDRPVINVNWNDAQAYVNWLSQRTGKPYRLPSESEWEYSARAGTTTAHYWGDAVGNGNANCSGCGSQWDQKQTSPVGSFRANVFGLYDMSGNVWQWTQDCYKDYSSAPTDGAAVSSNSCAFRVMRGGTWYKVPVDVRSALRMIDTASDRTAITGFRVARTL